MATRVAISIPQSVADGTFDPAGFRAYLARAEALGFDSAWTSEQVLGSTPLLGPIETMTYAAARTERLRLGRAMFVSPLYSPVHLAKSLSTLDQLSRGRIEVGVTTGGRFRMFSAFDVDPDSFVARFTEGLERVRPEALPDPRHRLGVDQPFTGRLEMVDQDRPRGAEESDPGTETDSGSEPRGSDGQSVGTAVKGAAGEAAEGVQAAAPTPPMDLKAVRRPASHPPARVRSTFVGDAWRSGRAADLGPGRRVR